MSQTSFLHSGAVGNIGMKQLKEQREMITNRWESLGLLEGLKGANKENIATLFENQATYLLTENTTTDSSGSFETVAFPVIRRIFAKLLANELVSVQALNLPVGRIYFYNPKISKRKADGSHYAMDGSYSNAAADYSLDSNGKRLARTGGTQFETFSLYDAYYATEVGDYGTALFDRTSGKITVKTPSITIAGYNGTQKYATIQLSGFSSTADGHLLGPVGGSPMDTEEFIQSLVITASTALVASGSTSDVDTIPAGKPIPYRVLPQKYGKGIVDGGIITLELDFSQPGTTGGAYIALSTGSTGTTFGASYFLYSDLEDDSEMAEVSFDMSYITIDVAEPKKLRATYTPEVAQDASAFHSINVEAELTSLMSETVAAEIDRGILRDLRNGAAWKARWDYNGYTKGGYTGITRKDYNQTLMEVINQISGQIQKSTLRGGANWIVVSAEIQAILNNLEYFHVTDASPEETKFSMGIEKIGSIQGRYTVYVDVYAPPNTILIGHKGDSIFSSGYIYAPYVPLMILPKMTDYKTGKSIHMLMSRFAQKFVNNRFYGKILVDGVVSYGIGELR